MTIPAILLSSFNNEPFHLSLKTKGPTIEEGWTRLAFVFLGTRIIYSGRATHTPGDKDSLGLLTKVDHMIQQLLKLRCRGLLRWQAGKSVTVPSEYLAYRPYVRVGNFLRGISGNHRCASSNPTLVFLVLNYINSLNKYFKKLKNLRKFIRHQPSCLQWETYLESYTRSRIISITWVENIILQIKYY